MCTIPAPAPNDLELIIAFPPLHDAKQNGVEEQTLVGWEYKRKVDISDGEDPPIVPKEVPAPAWVAATSLNDKGEGAPVFHDVPSYISVIAIFVGVAPIDAAASEVDAPAEAIANLHWLISGPVDQFVPSYATVLDLTVWVGWTPLPPNIKVSFWVPAPPALLLPAGKAFADAQDVPLYSSVTFFASFGFPYPPADKPAFCVPVIVFR